MHCKKTLFICYLTESPNKKSRLDAEGEVVGKGDEIEMDVEESAGEMQKNEDQGMDIKKDNVTDLQNIYKGLGCK